MSNEMKEALARISGSMTKVTEASPRARLCLYGRSGAGKTVLSAGIAKQLIRPGEKIIILDTSEGYESIKKHGSLADNIWQIPFTTLEDAEIIAQAIQHRMPPFDDVGCIILDEGSSISSLDTDRVYNARKTAGKTDSEVPEWPDYNVGYVRFRNMVTQLYDTPNLHVILIAHYSEKKDRKGNVIEIFPSFAPSIAKKVKENLHLVGYVSAIQVPSLDETKPAEYVRMVQVFPSALYDAKNRIVGMTNIKYSDVEIVQIIKNWIDAGGEEKEETFSLHPSELPEDEVLEEVETQETVETDNKSLEEELAVPMEL